MDYKRTMEGYLEKFTGHSRRDYPQFHQLRIKSNNQRINITRVGSILSRFVERRGGTACSPGCSFTAELFFTVPPIIHEHSIKLIDPTGRSFFTAKKPQTVFSIFISRDALSIRPRSVRRRRASRDIRHISRRVHVYTRFDLWV